MTDEPNDTAGGKPATPAADKPAEPTDSTCDPQHRNKHSDCGHFSETSMRNNAADVADKESAKSNIDGLCCDVADEGSYHTEDGETPESAPELSTFGPPGGSLRDFDVGLHPHSTVTI